MESNLESRHFDAWVLSHLMVYIPIKRHQHLDLQMSFETSIGFGKFVP